MQNLNLEELKDWLETIPDKELFRFLKKCICESLANDLNESETITNATLDMVYTECQRRGKERLYDKTYETVAKNPDICQTL